MNDYTYEELEVGHKEFFEVIITQETMNNFLRITNDVNPLHNNLEYAKSCGHEDKVVFGMLSASYLSTLCGVYLPGKKSLIHSVESKFLKPVFVKDSPLIVSGEVIDKNDLFRLLTLKVEIKNNKSEKVLKGKMKVGVLE